jgi:hypothetical protein
MVSEHVARHARRARREEGGSSALTTVATLALAFALLAGATLFALQATQDPGPERSSSAPAAPAPEPAAAEQLAVVCAEGGARVDAPVVNANEEGVSSSVEGSPGMVVSFASPTSPGYRFVLRGSRARGPLPLPPGAWSVACSSDPGFQPSTGFGAPFSVADPGAYYIASHPSDPASTCSWRGPLPDAFASDHDAALRSALSDDGLQARDVIEPASYPSAGYRAYPPSSAVFRVVREDEVLARIDVVKAEGEWTFSVLGCISG